MEVAVTYRGQPWTSISVDVARWEAGESDVEGVEAIVLTDAFGVTGPAQLPCLPLRFPVAKKLHGMTLSPRPDRQNERFRDLVDLMNASDMWTVLGAESYRDCGWHTPSSMVRPERLILHFPAFRGGPLEFLGGFSCSDLTPSIPDTGVVCPGLRSHFPSCLSSGTFPLSNCSI
jgi:hypothetical protein